MENWKAVELVKDMLFGLGLYAIITIVGLLVTMAISAGSDTLLLNDEVRGNMATNTLLWMIVPALLLSLGLAALRRIRMKNAALRVSIVWATLFGWMIWSDWPLPTVLAGAGIVVASNVLIIWRESRAGKVTGARVRAKF